MQMSRHRAVVLSHLTFEDLGSLEAPLRERGFEIETVQASAAHFPLPQAQSCELAVILGGPIGVYEQEAYPFLGDEIACIGQRLAARKPTLGICLGAQLMAAALGARVYPGGKGKEIGWWPLRAAAETRTPEWFAPLLEPGLPVFHWHGDTFDLPQGVLPLAGTHRYPHQAFTVGDFALGLQFHPEVSAEGLESWYVGHACELHQAGIAVGDLRSASRAHSAALGAAAARFWNRWLDHVLGPGSSPSRSAG
jgi:GMP synthase (glutamine-hydrolysing)